MGQILTPGAKISGTAGAPGIQFSDSPTGGIYETTTSGAPGMGMTLAGLSIFDLNTLSLAIGQKVTGAYSLTSQQSVNPASGMNNITLSSDGQHLYAGGASGNLVGYKRNLATGALTLLPGFPIATGVVIFNAVLSPNGKILAFCSNAGGLWIYLRNSQTGALTPAIGSPFAATASHGLIWSPDGAHLYQFYGANIYGWSVNSLTGGVGALSGSPYAAPAITWVYPFAFTPNGNFVYTNYATTPNNVYGWARNPTTGALSAIPSNPLVCTGIGNGNTQLCISPDNTQLLIPGYNTNNIGVYNINATTGALTPLTGSPFALGGGGTFPIGCAMNSDGSKVAIGYTGQGTVASYTRIASGQLTYTGQGGTGINPAQLLFSGDNNFLHVNDPSTPLIVTFNAQTNPSYPLITATFDPTGSLNGSLIINGSIVSQGTTVVAGTTTNDNAVAGQVGEYISSAVAATATGLTSGAPLNVTSISLSAGDWDIWGSVVFTGAATTSFTVTQGGANTVSATLPASNLQSYNIGTAFVPGGLFTTETIPSQRLSLATTTTVYLVAQSAFTVSTAGAGGTLAARRRR